jgi:quercetin dioxygenase-like cupin family protein
MGQLAQKARMQYVYDLSKLDREPDGPTSAKVTARGRASGATPKTARAAAAGAVLTGSQVVLTLGTQARGTGVNAHTHPNEQFTFIVQGTLIGEQGGERIFAPRGTVLHTPGGLAHTWLACAEEDLVFLSLKDTRPSIAGPSANGRHDAPGDLPGLGARAAERVKPTAELMAETRRDPAGEKTRYVHDFARLENVRPGRVTSAAVTPQVIPAASDAKGAVVTGDKLHVALLRYPRGGKGRVQANRNEQFTFVVEGTLRAEIAGEAFTVGRHCIAHIPPGVPHKLEAAGGEALVVTVQDARYAFAV